MISELFKTAAEIALSPIVGIAKGIEEAVQEITQDNHKKKDEEK